MERYLQLAVAGLLVFACGTETPVPADAGTDASASAPPTIRDVRVNLSGNTALTVDLGTASSTVILPRPTPSEWLIQVRDDQTLPDALEVTITDAAGTAVAGQEAIFERGNWRVTLLVDLDADLGVTVRDADGQATVHPSRLTIPSLSESLSDSWELRQYDRAQAIIGRTLTTFTAESWTEMGPAAGMERAGTWSLAEAVLLFEERTSAGGDAEPSTVELAEEGPLFVDQLYLSRAPWVRLTGGPSGAVGDFEREYTVTDSAGTRAVREELTLGADGSHRWRRLVDGALASDVEGTFVLELTENYEESLGDFLVMTDLRVDGLDVPAPEPAMNLFIDQGDVILLNPLIRIL